MKNTEKLSEIGELASVRGRMGAQDDEDETYDDEINKLSNNELVAKIAGWELGSESWWYDLKSAFDELEYLDKRG